MAKQTFTTGQVLTAAQVNSLQANDFNQTVSVKTANYTLAAADKGTRIEFNTSGSVTCTVNSGLFDAGDTLVIQNRGAGTATITAGTATVNTSASLALAQYSAGTLYFVSDSAALFFGDAAGISASIVDAKGDLIVGTADNTVGRLAVGTNGHTLVADSVEATGLKWVAPAAGGMTLINTGGTTLTGASTTVSSIPSGYRNLHIVIVNFDPATDNDRLTFQINGDGGANRYRTLDFNNPANTNTTFNGDRFYIGQTADDGTNTGITWIDIYEYDNTSIWKMIGYASVNNDWTTPTNLSDQWGQGYYNQTNAVTSLKFACQTGNLNAGTVYVYGVK